MKFEKIFTNKIRVTTFKLPVLVLVFTMCSFVMSTLVYSNPILLLN